MPQLANTPTEVFLGQDVVDFLTTARLYGLSITRPALTSLARLPQLPCTVTDDEGVRIADLSESTPDEVTVTWRDWPSSGPFGDLLEQTSAVYAVDAPLSPAQRQEIETALPGPSANTTTSTPPSDPASPALVLVISPTTRAERPGATTVTREIAQYVPRERIRRAPLPEAVRPYVLDELLQRSGARLLPTPGPYAVDQDALDLDAADGAHTSAGTRGVVVLFTGLSGSGKSTVARRVRDRVAEASAEPVTLLDGDVVRRHLSQGLGFSRTDREINVARIGWVAAQIASHGGLVLASPIAPFDETRQQVRQFAAHAGVDFVLVHISTPLAECERRDRKGLYARARAGDIAEFTGISSPYEPPQDADLTIDTAQVDVETAATQVLSLLSHHGVRQL